MVDVDGSSLSADSRAMLVGLVWGLAYKLSHEPTQRCLFWGTQPTQPGAMLKKGDWLNRGGMCDVCAVATDPLGDVLSFIHQFEQLYGNNHPEFYRGTYSQVS